MSLPSLKTFRTKPALVNAFSPVTRFVVIGDPGRIPPDEKDDITARLGRLTEMLIPDFVLTTGDNTYQTPNANYDTTVEPDWGNYMASIADDNNFLPVPGNHDDDVRQDYQDYFALPTNGYVGTEHVASWYQEMSWHKDYGPVRVFGLNSNADTSSTGDQATWLKEAIDNYAAPADNTSGISWNIVAFHHPPYTSGEDGVDNGHSPTQAMRWGNNTGEPFENVDLILNGHNHHYERLVVNGLTYIVNGAADSYLYGFDTPESESEVRLKKNGLLLVEATYGNLVVKFIGMDGTVYDETHITKFRTSEYLY